MTAGPDRPPKIIDAEFEVVSEGLPTAPAEEKEPLGRRAHRWFLRSRPWGAAFILAFGGLDITTNGALTSTIHRWLFGW